MVMTFRVHDTLDLRIPRDPLTHIYASVSLQDETDLLHILTPPIRSVDFPEFSHGRQKEEDQAYL